MTATQPDLTTQYTVVRSRTIFEPAVYVGLGTSDNSHQLELSLNKFGVFYWPQILVIPSDPCTNATFRRVFHAKSALKVAVRRGRETNVVLGCERPMPIRAIAMLLCPPHNPSPLPRPVTGPHRARNHVHVSLPPLCGTPADLHSGHLHQLSDAWQRPPGRCWCSLVYT